MFLTLSQTKSQQVHTPTCMLSGWSFKSSYDKASSRVLQSLPPQPPKHWA
jgi:hypothetical protein